MIFFNAGGILLTSCSDEKVTIRSKCWVFWAYFKCLKDVRSYTRTKNILMVLSKTIILLLLYIENPQNILETKNIGQFLENRGRIKYYFQLQKTRG